MQLHYISSACYPAGDNLPGTQKKIRSQVSCLKNLGVDVIHHHPKPVFNNKYISYIYSNLTRIVDYIILRHTINENDMIYIRRERHHISYLFLLLFKRRYKVIIESQTIDREEFLPKVFSNNGNIFQLLYVYYCYISCVLFEKMIKSSANAIVSVTSEIDEYNSDITNHQLQYLTLGNGIDVMKVNVREITSLGDSAIHVLCVAQVAKWHGIDRFIRGLHEYNAHYANSTKIVLHIVGDGSDLPHLKELTAELNQQDNVIYHGFKSGKELDEMFDMCHIAIGSLAGFRVGLNELSSLKSREYCARGIPFLMASKDADFPEGFNWVHMVPAEEQPINMNTVISFANHVMADPEHPQKMRRYAEEHLDWLAKMKVLKEFLESL